VLLQNINTLKKNYSSELFELLFLYCKYETIATIEPQIIAIIIALIKSSVEKNSSDLLISPKINPTKKEDTITNINAALLTINFFFCILITLLLNK